MFSATVILSLLASTVAFNVNTASRAASLKPAFAMSAEGLVGSLAPVGFFDPLALSSGKTAGEVKKFREAELKHGRVAMLAFVGILVGESFNPLFGGEITGPAIYQFQQADDLVSFFWVGVLFAIALVEGKGISNGWESPAETSARGGAIAQLKDDYVNGDLGFDPLGLTPKTQAGFDTLRTKELQNGRLAMLGVAGIVAQELVNNKGVLENLSA
eukprot:gene12782-17138_t